MAPTSSLGQEGAFAILVDTALAPPEERLGYWRAGLGRLFDAQVRITSCCDAGFHGKLAIHRIDRIKLLEGTLAPVACCVDDAPAEPGIVALAAPGGGVTVRQDARECTLGPGELCLYSTAAPREFELKATTRIVAIRVPEHEFTDLYPQARPSLLRPIAGNGGAPALFAHYADALARQCDALDPRGAASIADSVIHLLGAVACSAVAASPHCAHHAHEKMERMLRFARARLRDPELGVAVVARAVHLSPRQVHRLFASGPMSLMQWVLAQRLENCRRELGQRHLTGRSIGEIAYDWGFGDQAHFSRAFRKRYGCAPSQVPHLASGAGTPVPDAAPLPDDLGRARCGGRRLRSKKKSR